MPKIHLPNIPLVMLRPPGHQTASMSAEQSSSLLHFSMPRHLNKIDLREYLRAVYRVPTNAIKNVRTVVFQRKREVLNAPARPHILLKHGHRSRNARGGLCGMGGNSMSRMQQQPFLWATMYKRAIVEVDLNALNQGLSASTTSEEESASVWRGFPPLPEAIQEKYRKQIQERAKLDEVAAEKQKTAIGSEEWLDKVVRERLPADLPTDADQVLERARQVQQQLKSETKDGTEPLTDELRHLSLDPAALVRGAAKNRLGHHQNKNIGNKRHHARSRYAAARACAEGAKQARERAKSIAEVDVAVNSRAESPNANTAAANS